MANEYVEISYWQVGIAALLILVNGAVSLGLRLGIERRLVLAASRMTIQLLSLGFVLHWVFALRRWEAVLGLGVLMTLIAGFSAVGRTDFRYRGIWTNSLVSVWASAWLVTGLAMLVVVQAEPWYHPQYAVPFLGMILGNTLNGISLGLDRFGKELESNRPQIEALLTMGATSWEAAREPVREALRTGLIPIINAMLIAGVVSLPGMMTGQLLAGVDPVQAVKYQLVIMFLIAAGTTLGTLAVVVLSYRRLFNTDHQLIAPPPR